jgi:hypothetical protein
MLSAVSDTARLYVVSAVGGFVTPVAITVSATGAPPPVDPAGTVIVTLFVDVWVGNALTAVVAPPALTE